MSVSSPCEICLQREVRHTCNRCAQLVCSRHFDTQAGFCIECVAETGSGKDHLPPEKMPDGVDTYQS